MLAGDPAFTIELQRCGLSETLLVWLALRLRLYSSARATIEKEIHRSPNRARYAMNGALIAIGIYKPALRRQVLDAARRIGKVDVDHGETSCKTPGAVVHIENAV